MNIASKCRDAIALLHEVIEHIETDGGNELAPDGQPVVFVPREERAPRRGRRTKAQIAAATGLPTETVDATITKLGAEDLVTP